MKHENTKQFSCETCSFPDKILQVVFVRHQISTGRGQGVCSGQCVRNTHPAPAVSFGNQHFRHRMAGACSRLQWSTASLHLAPSHTNNMPTASVRRKNDRAVGDEGFIQHPGPLPYSYPADSIGLRGIGDAAPRQAPPSAAAACAGA